jgi:S1-C subfamily serine protease
MLSDRLPKARFGLKSLFVLILGIAIGFSLSKWPAPSLPGQPPASNRLGLRLVAVPRSALQQKNSRFRGGMRVINVRPDSPADKQDINSGDVLVGLGHWEIVSDEDFQNVMSRPSMNRADKLKFYLLRGTKQMTGQFDLVGAR